MTLIGRVGGRGRAEGVWSGTASGPAWTGDVGGDHRTKTPRFGKDPFPFGIEENRATWEQMLLYTYQQGIAHKHVRPEDIFPKGIMTKVIV